MSPASESPGEEKNLLAALDQSPFFYFAGLDRPAEPSVLRDEFLVEGFGTLGHPTVEPKVVILVNYGMFYMYATALCDNM